MNKTTCGVFALATVLSANAYAQNQGIGVAGTNEIGGSATFRLDTRSVGDESDSGTILFLNPGYGRFITDMFLLRGTFTLGVSGGDLYDSSAIFGIRVEPLFVMPAGGLFFYAGGLAGFVNIKPDEVDSLTIIIFGAQGGLLVPFNEWVALDVGLNIISETWDTEPESTTYLHIPIGALGVRGYF